MATKRTSGKPIAADKAPTIGYISTPIEDACGAAYGDGKAAVTEYLRMISAGPFVKIDRYRIDSLKAYQKSQLSAKWSRADLLDIGIDFLEGFAEQSDRLMIDPEKANGRSLDMTPQQTVSPVAAARDVAKPDTSGNAGLDGGDVIRMNAHRSNRFYHTLAELDDTITSLTTAVKSFPDPQCSPGQIEPRVAVLAFASHMDNLLGLLLAMANNEEHLNDDQREDDHAQR
jgi:hypothetical protein